MKRTHYLPLLLLITCSSSTYANTKANTIQAEIKPTLKAKISAFDVNDLIGQWRCPYQVIEPTTKIRADIHYEIDFKKSGQSEGTGHLFLTLEGMPGFKYLINDKSDWKLTDNKLTLVSKSLSFKNVTNPQFDQLLNLQSLFPKKVNESVTIIELSKSILTLSHKTLTNAVICSRSN